MASSHSPKSNLSAKAFFIITIAFLIALSLLHKPSGTCAFPYAFPFSKQCRAYPEAKNNENNDSPRINDAP